MTPARSIAGIALLAMVPMLAPNMGCSVAPVTSTTTVAEIEYRSETGPVRESLTRSDLDELWLRDVRGDGKPMTDPGAALTATRIELDGGKEPVVLVRDGSTLRSLDSRNGVDSVTWTNVAPDRWELVYASADTGSLGQVIVTADDPLIAQRVIGATALGLLGLMDGSKVDQTAILWVVVAIVVIVGISWSACMAGVCGSHCETACAGADGFGASWTCSPWSSTCQCTCLSAGDPRLPKQRDVELAEPVK
jgi:hypothetical protein